MNNRLIITSLSCLTSPSETRKTNFDLTNPDAQNFLFDNIKGFLFNEQAPQSAEIDTSKEGSVKW